MNTASQVYYSFLTFDKAKEDLNIKDLMPRQPIGPTSTKWCFTLNNPTGDQEEALWAMQDNEKRLEYAVWQKEIAPTTGTPHIQGYVILKGHAKPNKYMQDNFFNCRWKIANGSTEQNYVYCTKPGGVAGPWEYGIKPVNKQGKRNDLLAVKAKLDAGAPMTQIAEEHFPSFVRYERAFLSYMNIIQPKRDFKTQIIVLISSPRTGKSTWAKNHTYGVAGKGGFICYSAQWFNGYNGIDDIIINDFNRWIPWFNFLQMLDDGAWTVETKGGIVNFAPRRIVITSNFIVTQWFDYVKIKADIRALTGRIEYIYDEAIPANVVFFDNAWSDALVPAILDPYPIQVDVVSEGEVCPQDEEGRFILSSPPWSQAETWDEEDVGHALDSDYWERHLGENDADLLDDPHGIPFLDVEALEEAIRSSDLD